MDRGGRVARKDAAGHQVIEHLTNRGELLLDAWLSHLAANFFEIRGNRQRVDVFQREPPAFSPVEELFYRPGISAAGVAITNVGGEELDEAQACAHRSAQ